MRRYVWTALRAAILIGIVWYAWKTLPAVWAKWFPEDRKEVFVPTAKAERGDLVISVKELGNVKAERSIAVNSEIEGKVIYLIQEGVTVRPGDLLVQVDDTPLKDKVRTETLANSNAMSQVEKAKLEMEILKESNRTDYEQSEAQLNYDREELKRLQADLAKQERLAKDRLVPQSNVENAQIAVRKQEFAITKGEKALLLKKKDIESKENQKRADVRNVEFQAMMASERLKQAQSDLSKARITARGSGLVVLNKVWMGDSERKVKEGDNVRSRMVILEIPDLTSMQVTVQVGEADISAVRVGQKVRLTLDALPGKKFSGVVRDIATLASETMPWQSSGTPGRRSFEVTVQVIQSGATPLRPGMTANAEIINDIVRNCIRVPIEAVFEKNGKQIVYVRKSSGFRPHLVVTGKRNATYVEIKKGLAAGDVVALRDPTRQGAEEGAEPAKKESTALPAPVPEKDSKK